MKKPTMLSAAVTTLLGGLPVPDDAIPEILWMIRIQQGEKKSGLDSIQAAPSHEAAGRLATAMRDWLAGEEGAEHALKGAGVHVELWTGERTSHEQDLSDWPNMCRVWGVAP